MRMRPAVGSTKPAIRLSVVVFPHPEGPRRERNSPSRMASPMASTARTPPKSRVHSWSSTTALAITSSPSPSGRGPAWGWPSSPGGGEGTWRGSSVMEEDTAEPREAIGEPDHGKGSGDEERGHGGDGRIGVVDHVAVHGHGQDLRHAVRDEEGDHELVDGDDHREEERGDEAGAQERQGHASEDPPGRGPETRRRPL